ncbi:MAG: hypothetical protein K5657_06700 [Desulfovibrio sp.]|nr:hypothetical protein [Desulfovibrio sp.]
MGFFTGSVVNTGSDLINQINNKACFEVNDDGQLKTKSILSRMLTKISNIFTDRAELEARHAKVDSAMASLLGKSDPIVNPSKSNIDRLADSSRNIAGKYGRTLGLIQTKLKSVNSKAANRDLINNIAKTIDFSEIKDVEDAYDKINSVISWKSSADLNQNELKQFENNLKEDLNSYLTTFNIKNNFPDVKNDPQNEKIQHFHKQFIGDMDRQDITLGNTKYNRSAKDYKETIFKDLKQMFPDPKEQHFITSLLNQATLGLFVTPLAAGELNGQKLPAGVPVNSDQVFISTPKVNDGIVFNVTRQGNKAKIVLNTELTLGVAGGVPGEDGRVGVLPVKLTLDCDLAQMQTKGKKCTVTDLKFEYTVGTEKPGMNGGVTEGFTDHLNNLITNKNHSVKA